MKIDVGSLCQEISIADKGTVRSLNDVTAASTRPARFNLVHIWEGKRMRPFKKELTKANIQHGLFQLAKCQVNDTAYTISGEKKILESGAVQLKPHTYIVFDRSCKDVMLKDMVIVGAYIL